MTTFQNPYDSPNKCSNIRDFLQPPDSSSNITRAPKIIQQDHVVQAQLNTTNCCACKCAYTLDLHIERIYEVCA